MSSSLLQGQYGYIPFGLTDDLAFTCNDAVVQYMQTLGISTSQITFFRLLFTASICAAYLYIKDKPQLDLLRPELRLVWVRGVIDVSGLISVYQALEYMPISNVITVYEMRPFIVGFLCLVVLREAFTWRQVVACVVSVFAVTLVVQPEFLWSDGEAVSSSSKRTIIGCVLCLVGTTCQAIGMLILRRVKEVDGNVVIMIYASCGCLVSLIWAVVFQQPVVAFTGYSLGLIVVITLLGLAAQIIYLEAIKRAEGSKVACLSYSQIVWSVILQCSMTGIVPSPLAFLGMAIIIVAGVWAIVAGGRDESVEQNQKELQLNSVEREGLLQAEED